MNLVELGQLGEHTSVLVPALCVSGGAGQAVFVQLVPRVYLVKLVNTNWIKA